MIGFRVHWEPWEANWFLGVGGMEAAISGKKAAKFYEDTEIAYRVEAEQCPKSNHWHQDS